jgi:hypothetical protein
LLLTLPADFRPSQAGTLRKDNADTLVKVP